MATIPVRVITSGEATAAAAGYESEEKGKFSNRNMSARGNLVLTASPAGTSVPLFDASGWGGDGAGGAG
jgi:hypothetical protein